MKNKVVTIIVIICVIIVCFSLGFILVNMNTKEDENVNHSENIIENNVGEKEEVTIDNKGEKVVLDSKIGSAVLSKLYFPNIYSKLMYQELDKNGVSNDFKIMYTFALMSNYQEYSNYLREGEDYIGSYITSDDLEEVSKKYFYDVNSLTHKAVFDSDTYNQDTQNYVVVARGYAGAALEYIVEIPYEIYEYEDLHIEVKSYRVYIKRTYDSEDIMGIPKDDVYYDSDMKNLALSINDEKMTDEIDGQQDILKYKIETNEISKEKLDKTTWIFKKQEGSYLIFDYKLDI